MVLKAS